ncbi:hypothetical protein NC651_014965 [Populus alba x Populus x berolinensis]|nr:hypothetical protein NC651_014965 [Populus alba x Populus x berolinensis]
MNNAYRSKGGIALHQFSRDAHRCSLLNVTFSHHIDINMLSFGSHVTLHWITINTVGDSVFECFFLNLSKPLNQ